MSQDLKDQLAMVSANLQNSNATLATVGKLTEIGKVTIADATEGVENPIALTLNGNIVADIFKPVVATLNQRKEQMLGIKEQILAALENEISGEGGDAPAEGEIKTETAAVEKTDKPAKPAKTEEK